MALGRTDGLLAHSGRLRSLMASYAPTSPSMGSAGTKRSTRCCVLKWQSIDILPQLPSAPRLTARFARGVRRRRLLGVGSVLWTQCSRLVGALLHASVDRIVARRRPRTFEPTAAAGETRNACTSDHPAPTQSQPTSCHDLEYHTRGRVPSAMDKKHRFNRVIAPNQPEAPTPTALGRDRCIA